MPQDSGTTNRKLPEREDALKIDLPFEEAVKAALAAAPGAKQPKKRPRKRT